ncbi:transducin family protein / WD-40 repeat family protein [Melia azedarach]|uniref:Transducin family protein / WD-40 repeat family protein n=1 Tax=Melia azedarach TaxID=155640 RepID=A0ACC1WZ12_MELAZ|nr:transducin family protein / WD-40 repeat family protein [Melia azedarach]
MFAKRLMQKAIHQSQHNLPEHGSLTSADLDLQIAVHYGIPATASILAFDHIQRLLAIATLDGRIKFLQNQGFLISITNDDEIQVWNLESRSITCCLTWESNITAFSVISGSHFMYVGDEYGLMSVMKYDADEGKLLQLPYNISANSLSEVAEFPLPENQPVVGILPQPCSSGNRVLIAYENGLIILWDISEARILFVGGGKDLQLKDGVVDSPSETDFESPRCYIRASTARERNKCTLLGIFQRNYHLLRGGLPVIVLHWSTNKESRADFDGRLFIYGGDEIGSEEVLTVLSLEWSSGKETLKCTSRVDITLTGSFADMILLPSAWATAEKKPSVCPVEFPGVVPIADPIMTSAKFVLLPLGGNSAKGLSEIASSTKLGSSPTLAGHTKWPLTGGVPSQLSVTKDHSIDRVYLAGYQDGSVRIWDATYPVLKLICILDAELQGIKVAGSSAPVSTLNFCFNNSSLAVGNECGLVYIYNLNGVSDLQNFLFVSETQSEVHTLPEGKGPQYRAVFSLVDSPVRALQFATSGAKLAVGFECGRVAVLDMNFLSEFRNTHGLVKDPNHLETKNPVNPAEEVIFILFKDAKISIVDGSNGNMITSRPWHLKKEAIAISMDVIEEPACGSTTEKYPEQSGKENAAKSEPAPDASSVEAKSRETEHLSSSETESSGERPTDALVLLCCENSLHLCSRKSVIQGNDKSIRKTGEVEIRSLPELELVMETSLMSILRWNFKANMDKTISADNGQITLANGSEVAFICLLAGQNDFRIPQSLPCLHDNVLAAAADAALSVSSNQKKKQGTAPGILGGIVKGFKAGENGPYYGEQYRS